MPNPAPATARLCSRQTGSNMTCSSMCVAAGWFQELQRAVGARKLEAGFGVAAVGLALFGGTLIDAAWSRRNQGVRLSGGGRLEGWTVRRRTEGVGGEGRCLLGLGSGSLDSSPACTRLLQERRRQVYGLSAADQATSAHWVYGSSPHSC